MFAEAFWKFYALKKIERRNFVMGLIEQENLKKKEALSAALAELPAVGEYGVEN